jgi:hypothetical protein
MVHQSIVLTIEWTHDNEEKTICIYFYFFVFVFLYVQNQPKKEKKKEIFKSWI